MSGVDLGERQIRKGAADAIRAWLSQDDSRLSAQVFHAEVVQAVEQVARRGSTPLVHRSIKTFT
jgi:K+-transporting ATPase ATPase B chain